jgi:hypothetical protein
LTGRLHLWLDTLMIDTNRHHNNLITAEGYWFATNRADRTLIFGQGDTVIGDTITQSFAEALREAAEEVADTAECDVCGCIWEERQMADEGDFHGPAVWVCPDCA